MLRKEGHQVQQDLLYAHCGLGQAALPAACRALGEAGKSRVDLHNEASFGGVHLHTRSVWSHPWPSSAQPSDTMSAPILASLWTASGSVTTSSWAAPSLFSAMKASSGLRARRPSPVSWRRAVWSGTARCYGAKVRACRRVGGPEGGGWSCQPEMLRRGTEQPKPRWSFSPRTGTTLSTSPWNGQVSIKQYCTEFEL